MPSGLELLGGGGGGSFGYGENISDQGSSSSSTTSSFQKTEYPEWYKTYVRDLINRGTAQANKPLEQYGGNRVADFNPDQLRSFEMIRDAAENPAWQQYVDQYEPLMQRAPGLMGEAADLYRRGSTFDPAEYDKIYGHVYDPAVQALQAEANRIGQRDFQDTTLAQLNRNFGGSGQWGGSRHQILGADAAARAQAEIEGKKAGAMMQGRTSASQDYLNWARQGIQSGQALEANAKGGLDLARGALDYGMGIQGAIGKDASALGTIGQQQQDQSQKELDWLYSQFQEKQQYPWQQINNLRDTMKGVQVPVDSSSGTSSSQSQNSWGSTTGYNLTMNLPGMQSATDTGTYANQFMQGFKGGVGTTPGLG
jgi:hypothetical protein